MGILKNIFEKVLSKPRPHYESSTPFKIKPSVLGSKCERQIFYSATNVKPDVDFPLDGKKRMKLGDAIHAMLEDVYTEAGILIKYYNPDGSIPKDHEGKDDREFPIFSDDLFIKKAKIDAVYIIEGKLYLGEYKSINTKGFTSLHMPKPDHLIQGVTYLYLFNKMLAEGWFKHIKELDGFTKAEGVIFLYVHKDDTDFKEFFIQNADNTFEAVVNKIFRIKQYADTNTLPPCTPDWGRTCNCGWQKKSKNNQLK